MSIKARLKRLEKKVAASEPPMREIGVFAGKPLWRTEERDGVIYALPLMTNEEYAAMVYEQQCSLLAELAEKSLELERAADKAPIAGMSDQLAPGARRPNYIFRNEGGKEVQINTRSGERTVIKGMKK